MSSIFTKPDTIYSGYTGTPEKWVKFISLWAEKISKDIYFPFDEKVIRERAVKIQRAEDRLQTHLPKSYKDFILATGKEFYVRSAGGFQDALYSIEKIEWLIKSNPIDINLYMKGWYGENYNPNEVNIKEECSDEDYYQYNKNQDGGRVSYMAQMMKIGDDLEEPGRNIILLNPLEKTKDGEWEGGFYSAYDGYIVRFYSFASLMVYFYVSEIVENFDLSWKDYHDDPYDIAKILFE